jgi:predicted permease
MSDNKTQTQTGGIGFFGLLAIVFITLKLTGYIAWSWWWVLSPLWMPLAVVLGFVAIVFIFAMIFDKK